ncbi:MAG: T9SS type A sorting domain-containing protein [Bacteroidetes bacterium]|nr:T9SS type A sorting domain-containing protein [Bacteroidota bacterium]
MFAAMELHYPYSNIKWLVDNVLAATGDSVAISNIGLGTHIIKVLIKTPYCLSKTYFTITLNDLPQPSLGNDTTVCAGLVLDAGGGYSNYFWSNGATSQIVNATNSGAYTVTVTDTNGCMASDVMVATINPNPTINLGNDTSSCNAPVTLNAFGPNLSYLWNTGELTSSIIADTSGLYFVVVIDTNGCATSDSILFINNPLPAAPTISLNGFTFTSSVAAGNQWFLNGNLIVNATSQMYNAMQPGWYSVLVTDTNGCYSWSDSLFVTNTNFNEYALQNGVAATVNGSTHTLTIKGLTQNVVKSIKLIDAMGSVVYANNDLSNKFQIEIPIFNLSKGVYFIQVISKNHNEAIKILLH